MGEQSSRAQGFAFIKSGEFSHVNQAVLAQLKARFPHLEPTVVDLHDLNIVRKRDLAGLIASVTGEYGVSAILGRQRFRRHMYKTSYMLRRARKELLERLSKVPYAFTFQTQSMFDGSVPGIPHFIYTDHTHLENLKYPIPEAATPLSRTWAAMEKTTFHNARTVFTMSSNISRSLTLEYGCPQQKVECVYAGSNVSAEMARGIDDSRFSTKRILFVGVDWERKGGPVLLDAFRRVRRTHPDAKLTIVGCSPQIGEPGVHVAGRVPLQDVARYYREAAVFCLPTLNEPFGLVFLEAGTYGLPVVGTPIGAIPEIVIAGETGELIEARNSTALADCLSALLADPERCRRMGARGSEWVSRRYTWSQTGERMAAHIERAIERSPHANVQPPGVATRAAAQLAAI